MQYVNRSEINTHIMFSISSNNIVRISITEITRRLSTLIVTSTESLYFLPKCAWPSMGNIPFHIMHQHQLLPYTTTASVVLSLSFTSSKMRS